MSLEEYEMLNKSMISRPGIYTRLYTFHFFLKITKNLKGDILAVSVCFSEV